MQTISFRLERATGKDMNDAPCTHGWVSGRIYGREIGSAGAPVSYFDLLAYRGLSCEFTLLTCSCGVSGCAGYHDNAHQVWGEKIVEWYLNHEEYRPHFPGWNPHEDRPEHMFMRLDTAAFSAALDNLLHQVKVALEDGPLHLAPGWDDEPLRTFEEFLEAIGKQRAWLLEQREHEARQRSVFGPLYDLQVRAHFTNGAVHEAYMNALLRDVLLKEAESLGIEPDDDSDEHVYYAVENVWLPRFLAEGAEPVLTFIQNQPWDTVEHRFFRVKDADKGGTLRGSVQSRWRTARLEAFREPQ